MFRRGSKGPGIIRGKSEIKRDFINSGRGKVLCKKGKKRKELKKEKKEEVKKRERE